MKVSFIIPVYNAELHIKKCVDSIITQDDMDIPFEIIIVNDCSTDNSECILNNFESTNIKVINLKSNVGSALARNIGIDNATGDYIFFVDNDDEVTSDFFNTISEYIDKKFDILLFDYNTVYSDRTTYSHVQYVDYTSLYYPVVIWNKLYKREIVPYFVEKTIEDIVFSLTILDENLKVIKVDKSIYILNRKQLTGQSSNFSKEKYLITFKILYGYNLTKVQKRILLIQYLYFIKIKKLNLKYCIYLIPQLCINFIWVTKDARLFLSDRIVKEVVLNV